MLCLGALAVIGGSGLYSLEGLTNVEEVVVKTPFGAPSSPIVSGQLNGAKVLFLARHGPGHKILPSEINFRANIYALKTLEAEWCLSISAVGSLREELSPGHLFLPDQFIDRTLGRAGTFFGEGLAAHVSLADPVCPVLYSALFEASRRVAKRRGFRVDRGGTYVCIEGPAFSTRAESQLYRQWGASVIGMTALTEAKLAREAEMAYGVLALVTDYDCWRAETEAVHVEEVIKVLSTNVEHSKEIIRELVAVITKLKPSDLAAKALSKAIITAPNYISEEVVARLGPIVARAINGNMKTAKA